MKKKRVTIGSRELEVDVVRSSRRTVALYVRPGGTLLIRAPWYVPFHLLMQFVHRKSVWIEKQLIRLKDYQPIPETVPVHDGSVLTFMGRQLIVSVITGKRNSIKFENDKLIITAAGDFTAEKITALTETWYLREARAYFVTRTGELAARYSALLPAPGPVGVRKMKRRWGTCHSNGAIWFNRELIKRAPELIDYVIIHELCHLVHHNHSKDYYALLGSIIPDYKELRKRLQTA